MRFVNMEGEKKVSDLAQRIFVIKGRGAAEALKRATAALLEANPHLKDLKAVPAGSLIAVPEIPGLQPVPQVPTVQSLAHSTALRAITVLRGSGEAVLSSVDRRQVELDNEVELLKAKELKTLARGEPEWKKRVTEANKAVRAELKDLKDLRAVQGQVNSQLEKDLDEFLALHRIVGDDPSPALRPRQKGESRRSVQRTEAGDPGA